MSASKKQPKPDAGCLSTAMCYLCASRGCVTDLFLDTPLSLMGGFSFDSVSHFFGSGAAPCCCCELPALLPTVLKLYGVLIGPALCLMATAVATTKGELLGLILGLGLPALLIAFWNVISTAAVGCDCDKSSDVRDNSQGCWRKESMWGLAGIPYAILYFGVMLSAITIACDRGRDAIILHRYLKEGPASALGGDHGRALTSYSVNSRAAFLLHGLAPPVRPAESEVTDISWSWVVTVCDRYETYCYDDDDDWRRLRRLAAPSAPAEATQVTAQTQARRRRLETFLVRPSSNAGAEEWLGYAWNRASMSMPTTTAEAWAVVDRLVHLDFDHVLVPTVGSEAEARAIEESREAAEVEATHGRELSCSRECVESHQETRYAYADWWYLHSVSEGDDTARGVRVWMSGMDTYQSPCSHEGGSHDCAATVHLTCSLSAKPAGIENLCAHLSAFDDSYEASTSSGRRMQPLIFFDVYATYLVAWDFLFAAQILFTLLVVLGAVHVMAGLIGDCCWSWLRKGTVRDPSGDGSRRAPGASDWDDHKVDTSLGQMKGRNIAWMGFLEHTFITDAMRSDDKERAAAAVAAEQKAIAERAALVQANTPPPQSYGLAAAGTYVAPPAAYSPGGQGPPQPPPTVVFNPAGTPAGVGKEFSV